MRMSDTRKMLLRPLSKNGTIGLPVENYPRNKSVRLSYLQFRHLTPFPSRGFRPRAVGTVRPPSGRWERPRGRPDPPNSSPGPPRGPPGHKRTQLPIRPRAVLGCCGAAGSILRWSLLVPADPVNHGTRLASAAAIVADGCLYSIECPSEELLDGRDAFTSQTWHDFCRHRGEAAGRVARRVGAGKWRAGPRDASVWTPWSCWPRP